MNHSQTVGTTVGGGIGAIKGILMTKLTLLSVLSWGTLESTVILTALGATTGFIVTEVLKYLKSIINKNKE